MAKKADVTYVNVKAAVAYQFARGKITWTELKATSVSLNYYSLNQYFDDAVSFSDVSDFNLSKIADPDSLTLSDSQQLSLQKQLIETLSVSDNVDIVLTVFRNFSDSTAISDVAVLTVEKGFTETVTVSELLTMNVSLAKADAVPFTDAFSFFVDTPYADAVSVNDSFGRTVSYVRSFTDAFSLDDTETHINGAAINKTNVFRFTDVNTFSLQKNVADSVALSESFSHTLARHNHSVLNTSAFNTFALNS
jgi:hypothetical protein